MFLICCCNWVGSRGCRASEPGAGRQQEACKLDAANCNKSWTFAGVILLIAGCCRAPGPVHGRSLLHAGSWRAPAPSDRSHSFRIHQPSVDAHADGIGRHPRASKSGHCGPPRPAGCSRLESDPSSSGQFVKDVEQRRVQPRRRPSFATCSPAAERPCTASWRLEKWG